MRDRCAVGAMSDASSFSFWIVSFASIAPSGRSERIITSSAAGSPDPPKPTACRRTSVHIACSLVIAPLNAPRKARGRKLGGFRDHKADDAARQTALAVLQVKARARGIDLQARPRLCRLARSCPSATHDCREAEARTYLKDGASRHPPALDHRCHDRRQMGSLQGAAKGSWLARILAAKPRLVAAIDYRGSALAPA